ncbi:Uncharacterized membrane protein [Natronoarchaeum philippinense]|uniref:Uncharacterized membrane protein n=1 Tax=Natronoarchaeum philippinense TaxID=558529 RepID=A0A285N820_NATPI|nr:DUF63 family protein [Natronoarchaeum philippinense]SNZ05468.1 Uncharacterized membrane protein [Natronoarchaeum philippinense]
MDELSDRIDPARAWLAVAGAVAALLALGSVLFPRRVYDGFLWRYYWGPVAADGTRGAKCAVRHNGETTFYESVAQCRQAAGYVAEPGYTTVSTVSYALVLVFMLVGVYLLIQRLDFDYSPATFYALVPYVFFGGALRVVEDVSVAVGPDSPVAIPFPFSALFISPFIYFTVFAITLSGVLLGIVLQRRGDVERFQVPLAALGSVVLAVTLAWLAYAVTATEVVEFNPLVPAITLGGATVLAGVTWLAIEQFAPEINRGTGYMGLVIIWGHLVDGIANVLSLDWAARFGLPAYAPKHVVNGWIHRNTADFQPAWMTDLIGETWPFIFVKLGAAVFVVWVFDDKIFEDSPAYALLLLVTVLAVGLGPGSRDFLRATLGI